MDQKTASVC